MKNGEKRAFVPPKPPANLPVEHTTPDRPDSWADMVAFVAPNMAVKPRGQHMEVSEAKPASVTPRGFVPPKGPAKPAAGSSESKK